MSDDDDDYYYEDDEYLYIDYGPVAEADDLAEHTMHSPVLLGTDPSFQLNDDFSDWQYYSDDYFDELHEPSVQKRRKLGDEEKKTNVGPVAITKRKRSDSSTGREKRRKLVESKDTPELSLCEARSSAANGSKPSTQVVRWKEGLEEDKLEPFPDDQVGNAVSLMPDWRERLGIPVRCQRSEHDSNEKPPTRKVRTRKSTMRSLRARDSVAAAEEGGKEDRLLEEIVDTAGRGQDDKQDHKQSPDGARNNKVGSTWAESRKLEAQPAKERPSKRAAASGEQGEAASRKSSRLKR